MSKRVFILGLMAAFLSVAVLPAAAGETVYVTEKGSKYHKKICQLVKNKENLIEMNKDEAREADYEPCKRCFKEDLVANQSPKQKQLSKASTATGESK